MKDLTEIQYEIVRNSLNESNNVQILNNNEQKHQNQLQPQQQQSQHQQQYHQTNSNKNSILPKKFSAKKADLLIYKNQLIGHNNGEMINGQKEKIYNREYFSEIKNELKSLKTISDLRKSILAFGGTPRNNYNHHETQNNTPFIFNRQNTLESLSFYKEHEHKNDYQYEKIRPGYSAKRYLANLTRHWRPDLLENLSKNGKIKEGNMFEESDVLPNVKFRIDDDLSRIPPLYKIQRKWLAMTIAPLKGYRFYRAKPDMMGLSKNKIIK